MDFRQRRFQKNIILLANYFADISKMNGIIIKIEVEKPYMNYVSSLGDPMKENTLQLVDTDDNTLLFYKADRRVPVHDIMKGVTVITSYEFTEKNIVRILTAPVAVPKILEEIIFRDSDISQKLKMTKLTDNALHIFLDKHFVQGDMTRLSVFTDKLDWQKYFRDCVDVKVVSICKSCRKKANKKCCVQYNSANRTTALVVIGWVEKSPVEHYAVF